MKRYKVSALLVFIFTFLCLFTPFTLKSSYGKDVRIGISINDGKLSHFYFSIGDYYRIPVEKVIIVKKRYPFILDEELPIVFLISKYRGIEPDIIIKMRKRGYSWYSIMIHFDLYPERLFKKYIVVYGPPYGKAWGYYKHHPKREKVIVFTDRDIIELANIKFLAEYHHKTPDEIIYYKKKCPKYVEINEIFLKH
jgi:hypothetical protein